MSGIVAEGTVIAVGDGASPPSYTPIGHIVSSQGPGSDRGEIDVTTLDSTGKEFQLGFVDGGEFNIEVNHKPGDAGQAAVKALFETSPPPLRSWPGRCSRRGLGAPRLQALERAARRGRNRADSRLWTRSRCNCIDR